MSMRFSPGISTPMIRAIELLSLVVVYGEHSCK
jgi:hypothetical protein